ncbi:MAG: hypothetical protein SF172_16095 [Burkholderiales bacterium]|nr:hypothetical protein [Burkholderiales bacterium]
MRPNLLPATMPAPGIRPAALTSLLLLATFLCASVAPPAQAETIWSRLFGVGESLRYEINTPTHGFTVRVHGSLTINDAEDDVTTVTHWAAIEERREGVKRAMTFKLEKNGQVSRNYTVGGRPMPVDDEARRWLARVLPVMLRETGLQREQRIDRIMAKAGPAAAHRAVIDEMKLILSAHSRRKYAQSLLGRGPLPAAEFAPFMAAVADIDGDYDKRQVLNTLIDKQTLTPALQAEVLKRVAQMSSDYEQRSVLVVLAPKLVAEPAVAAAWQSVLRAMDSDHERGEVVRAMVRREGGSPAVIDLALSSAREIAGDFERAGALAQIAKQLGTPSAAQVVAYADAASGIRSDFERRNALEALVKRAALDKAGHERVLAAMKGMQSDHEIRQVLVTIARQMPADPALVARWRDVARMLSEHERGQAERAMDERKL